MNTSKLVTAVEAQVELLRRGKPLEALGACFAAHGKMYSNGALFASGYAEAREKQLRYITNTRSIIGAIEGLHIDEEEALCVFRNRSRFVDADGVNHQIDGLCWQLWEEGRVVEERYFDGALMAEQIARGVLTEPSLLLPESPGTSVEVE